MCQDFIFGLVYLVILQQVELFPALKNYTTYIAHCHMSLPGIASLSKPHMDLYLVHQKKRFGDDWFFQLRLLDSVIQVGVISLLVLTMVLILIKH